MTPEFLLTPRLRPACVRHSPRCFIKEETRADGFAVRVLLRRTCTENFRPSFTVSILPVGHRHLWVYLDLADDALRLYVDLCWPAREHLTTTI